MARNISITVIPTQIQNLRTTNVTQTTIALAWDVYPGATAYQVYRSTTQGSLGTLVLAPTATTYSNSGHTAGTTYYYTVRPVVGGSGVASAQASIVVVTVGASTALYAGYTPTIYAAPTALGNGSGSSEANATTLPSALASVSPGSVVGLLPGIYQGVGTDSRQVPSFQPTMGGTSGSPVRIVAKYPAAKNVGQTGLYSELRYTRGSVRNNPVIGVNGKSHVEFNGFYIRYSQALPAYAGGAICVWSSPAGVVIRNMLIDGDWYSGSPDDNVNGIFLSDSGYWSIYDNVFNGTASNSGSDSSIETYGCAYFSIEYNTFYAEGGGAVNIKGTGTSTWYKNQAGVIRYNRVYDGGINIGNSDGIDVYQNLMTGTGKVYFFDFSAGGGYENVRIYNNTVVNNDTTLGTRTTLRLQHPNASGGYPAGGNGWYDNILYTVAGNALVDGSEALTTSPPLFSTIARNVYFRVGGGGSWSMGANGYNSLANWQSGLAAMGAGVNAREPGSLLSDPLFVGGGDYRLQAGSPALAGVGGRTTTAGAYITGAEIIGARA